MSGCRCVVGLVAALTALSSLPACATASHRKPQRVVSTTAASSIATATTTTAAAPSTPASRTEKWIDLQVGECLREAPPADPSVVTVTIVDCGRSHRAEVYSRTPVAVDAAIAEVANRACAAEFSRYTGRALGGSPFSMTYLIDSNQDRTSDNPEPSTVICLLEPADGQPTTGSARR